MATNSELTSEAGLVELLGRERYDDYFNEAVGGDSTMGVGDISANVDIFDNACAMESIIDELLLEAGLPGVEVCAETTIVATNDQQSFYWEGYGLRLNIPRGSLPKGVEQCTIKILASLAGQYEFPEESYLVSGVFWLRCEPMVKFTKLMSLEIQHCAKAENVSKLSFVRAVCTQEELPYTFKPLYQVISSRSSYGLTRLQHFSGVAITQEGSRDRGYVGKLFYRNRSISNNYYDIHFVVTWDIDLHHTDMKNTYSPVVYDLDLPVEFEDDQISLDIPMEGINLKGWELKPLFPPVVKKENVDSYEPGRRIPRCELSAKFKPETRPIPDLEYCVQLIGAKEPYNTFHIERGIENQQNPPYHYNQLPVPPQAPPMGEAPPLPPGQQFGRGGGFPPRAQGPPPPGSFVPQQQQYRHPPPQQFRAPPPGQQQAPPTFHPPGPMQHSSPPHAQWGEQRLQPGMEQGYHPPPGMDPRHSQSGGLPFTPLRVDPQYQQQGGPMNPPQGGMGSDPWRPPPDQMPPPPASQQQHDGSRWYAPPPNGPPVNAPPSYQPPSHQQNSNTSATSGRGPIQQPQPPYPPYNTDQSQRKRSLVTDGMDLPPSSAKKLRQDSSPLNLGEHPLPTEENETDKDFIHLPNIEHHFVDLIKWKDDSGMERVLRVYSKTACKWQDIATRLGLGLDEISTIKENCHHQISLCIKDVFKKWFEHASCLPNAKNYPKSWQGLINLLKDAELGEVAEELKIALTSQTNSVRGNYS